MMPIFEKGRLGTTGAGSPLAGLKVIDLTDHIAGWFCKMILADMRAEVVKQQETAPKHGFAEFKWRLTEKRETFRVTYRS